MGSVYNAKVKSVEMQTLCDLEIKRHCALEAHHPQYELYNDAQCTDVDIFEMALDRLSRNAQFGNGWIDLNFVKKYTPTFPKGDNERKQIIFWQYVLKYKDQVQREFHEMFPESLCWVLQV